MGLLEEVAQHTLKPGFGCSVGVWLKKHPEYTDAEIREAADANSKAALWRFMKDKGFTNGALAVTRHLNGDCQCR